MKRILYFISLAFIAVLFAGCTASENEQLIKGKWQGVEWLENGSPSALNVAGTSFNFDEKGGYNFDYGSTKQTGTYKVENDMLFTTPAGDREIMVKILKITKDSLVFDMNRSGKPEQLTLIRK